MGVLMELVVGMMIDRMGMMKVVVKDVVKQERRRWDVTAMTSSSGDEWCL